MKRNVRSASRVAGHLAGLSIAAPQVVAHRLARFAAAGPRPSHADRREFLRMHTEKTTAFSQAWVAMVMQAWRLQAELLQAAWGAWLGAPQRAFAHAPAAALRIAAAGLAPVHAKAAANARRLGRRHKSK